MSEPTFVAVDWGTTSFRLWTMNAEGKTLNNRQGGFGMSTLKPGDFEVVLEESLGELGVGKHIPVVICGMAGAAQGWYEATYIDLPTPLASVPYKAIKVPNIAREVHILPGLAQRETDAPDVMRGEETLLLGAVLEKGVSGTLCLPGTHSKWARVEDGIVIRFSTAMTGELFGLLAQQSTLAHFTSVSQGSFVENQSFAEAVTEVMARPEKILQLLFSVRSIPLLFGGNLAHDMPGRLSGLLIGLEIVGMQKQAGEVTLIAGGLLAQNYAQAFAIAGIEYRQLSTDEMAQSGLFYAAKQLWPKRFNLVERS